MIKTYFQATDRDSLLPHPINEWKLKTTTEEERQTESIVRLSFEVKIPALTIKLAYNLKCLVK